MTAPSPTPSSSAPLPEAAAGDATTSAPLHRIRAGAARHGGRTAVAVLLEQALVVIGGSAAVSALAPDLSPLARSLAVTVPLAVLAILLVGYVLTGVFEELLWRGTVLRLLAPTGALAGVLAASALFGAAHLTNVLFRESVALVVAQAVGAACFGVGYAAVRLRIGTIVPLMVLHFLTDLCAAVGRLPKIPVLVAQDVILLGLGLYLLRRGVRSPAPATATGQ